METLVVDHPLVADRLTRLRDERSEPAVFRPVLDELATLLVYEATRALPTRTIEVHTPMGVGAGRRLAEPPVVVPVLRAGLGMLGAALRLLPEAETGFVGLKRDETTFEPRPYLNTLPEDLAGRTALVLDPMIATGGSLEHTLELVAAQGAGLLLVVCVVASSAGLDRIERTGLAVSLVTAAVDERLTDAAYVVPGLGDAGDRQYGEA